MRFESKVIQVRDEGTHIDCLAFRLHAETDRERQALSMAGYGELDFDQSSYLFLMKLNGPEVQTDPFKWGRARTMNIAHSALDGRLSDCQPEVGSQFQTSRPLFNPKRAAARTFERIETGGVLDVEWILGEKDVEKVVE